VPARPTSPGLQRGRGTVKLAIHIPGQIFGNLQGPALNLALFKAGHAI
jgi:hypothetical protein